jgi:pimeloyl-ACP methyl ester carboxylesterase
VAELGSMTLSDGRTLAFYEYGDKRGVPCIYIPGTPVSGLAGAAYNDAALSAGVRWISVDKPGYGHSDFNPSGTLLSFCDDVTELANHLGLDRFAVAGESGGGPYALALAYRRADRLTVSLILAGMGPGRERWARKGMRPSNRLLLMAAQRASWLLRPMMKALAWMVADDMRSARIGARQAKRLPAGPGRACVPASAELHAALPAGCRARGRARRRRSRHDDRHPGCGREGTQLIPLTLTIDVA